MSETRKGYSVACVIVTYNNKEMLESLLNDIYAQTLKPCEVLVIDNSVNQDSQDLIKEKFTQLRYLRPSTNAGSAGGFYEGIKIASMSHDLIWLLDDDVAVEPDALEELVKNLRVLQETAKVGAVRSWCTKQCPFSTARKTSSFAWRGTMITRKAIEIIGLPKAEYFLYYEDIEYAWRLVKNGFDIYWIPTSKVCEQRFDDKQSLRIGKATVTIYRDKAKLYYAFRNQINLCLLYKRWWCLVRVLLYAVKVASILLVTDNSGLKEKMCAIHQGIRDGFRARLGRNDAYSL